MGLHNMGDDGVVEWHCVNPKCRYHNCSEWHPDLSCPHHPHEHQKHEGETLKAHLTHKEVYWTGGNTIALPECPHCPHHTRMFIRVPSDEEMEMPVVERDKFNRISRVIMPENHPAPNHILIETALFDVQKPHPETGRMMDAKEERIVDVRMHPCIGHHRKLAAMLKQHGKHPPED